MCATSIFQSIWLFFTYYTLDHLLMYSFVFFLMYEAFGYVIIVCVTLVNFSTLLIILLRASYYVAV